MPLSHRVKVRAIGMAERIGGEELSLQLHKAAIYIEHKAGLRDRHPIAPPCPPSPSGLTAPGADAPVRVVPPRIADPLTGKYPALPAAPRRRRLKRRLPHAKLDYFPTWHTPDHPREWTFPSFLEGSTAQWVRALRAIYADPLCFPSSISPEGGLLLYSIVRNVRPRLVVETGTFLGISTIWIAAALHDNGDSGTVHTFDDFAPVSERPWSTAMHAGSRRPLVEANLCAAGLADRVVLHPGQSMFELGAFAPDLRAAGGVELAFLDADHSVRGVWHDFWALEPALRTGGFVLLHDTFPDRCAHVGPRHLLDTINRHAAGVYRALDMYLSPINYGMGLVQRVG